jgi:hypothetical protein
MFKKIVIILFIIFLFSCKNLQNNKVEFRNINKYLVCFNYSTKEICLINIETGNIDKKYRIEMDILKGGALNSHRFSYEWFYKENDNNVYLMETSRGKSITRIYKINIDNFEISEIFKTDLWYYSFFIEDNNLYLMKFIEPSDGKLNYDQNYFVFHNLLFKDETIINFNELLPEDEQVRAPDFFIDKNKIIFIGYRKIYYKKLFKYDMIEKTIKIIDEYVDNFSVNNDIILNNKNDVEKIIDGIIYKGTNLSVYSLMNNNYKILPYEVYGLFQFLIMDENTIIYDDIIFNDETTTNSSFDEFFLTSSREKYTDYYIANININKRKLFFSTRDDIMILGVMNIK